MKKYEKYLKIIEENNIFISNLEILESLKSFDKFNNLERQYQEKIFDLVCSYYNDNDLIENTIFDLCFVVINELDNIKQCNYESKEFYKIIDKIV